MPPFCFPKEADAQVPICIVPEEATSYNCFACAVAVNFRYGVEGRRTRPKRNSKSKRLSRKEGESPILGLLTKVIFLDMVPSSSADMSRAMTAEATFSKLPEKTMAGTSFIFVLVSFHTKDVFCILSRLLVRPSFRLFFCSFGR